MKANTIGTKRLEKIIGDLSKICAKETDEYGNKEYVEECELFKKDYDKLSLKHKTKDSFVVLLCICLFNEKYEIAWHLLSNGVDPRIHIIDEDNSYWYPLQCFLTGIRGRGTEHFLKLVIDSFAKAGVDFNSRDGGDETPLVCAAENSDCNIEILRELIKNGADSRATSNGAKIYELASSDLKRAFLLSAYESVDADDVELALREEIQIVNDPEEPFKPVNPRIVL